MWFADPQMVDIRVCGLAEALPVSYSKAGLRKIVSCEGLRPGPSPLLLALWGPVRPRYFPSLIDSRDGLRAGTTVSVYKASECALGPCDPHSVFDRLRVFVRLFSTGRNCNVFNIIE